MKIVADERIPYIEEIFGKVCDLTLKPGRELTASDVQDADAIIVRTVTRVDESLLAGSKVKFVGTVTAGSDHIDKDWLVQQNILFANAAGFNAPAVADYVVSAVAALSHRDLLMQAGKKAAVIGVGQTGSRVAERLQWLGFDVVVCDPLRAQIEEGFSSMPLTQIENVDLITLHVPLTDSGDFPTREMINGDFLRRQKQGCVLLNTSRGDVIHAKDLEKFGGHLVWCFDVWPNEPHISKSMLLQTMLATPHIAGYSVQSKLRGTQMIYEALCKVYPELACERQPFVLPNHQASFAGDAHTWRDVVLGIYNPIVTTAMMRATLFPVDETATYFDEMRHQFRYRHELSYTAVTGVTLSKADMEMVKKLGVQI